MTAPRTCRKCGAALPPSVRWCGQCLEPVRELSPRPSDAGNYVAPLLTPPRYSRWRAGSLTFGPVGRVAITVVVVLVGSGFVTGGFNPAMLWMLSGYVVAATLILKQTWARVRIPDAEVEAGDTAGTPSPSSELRARHPVLFKRIDPRILCGAAGVIAVALVFAITRSMSVDKLFLPIAALLLVGVGLVQAWLSGI
jgi:hypothetical protein